MTFLVHELIERVPLFRLCKSDATRWTAIAVLTSPPLPLLYHRRRRRHPIHLFIDGFLISVSINLKSILPMSCDSSGHFSLSFRTVSKAKLIRSYGTSYTTLPVRNFNSCFDRMYWPIPISYLDPSMISVVHLAFCQH